MNTPTTVTYKPNLKLRHFKRYFIAAGSSICQIQKKKLNVLGKENDIKHLFVNLTAKLNSFKH